MEICKHEAVDCFLLNVQLLEIPTLTWKHVYSPNSDTSTWQPCYFISKVSKLDVCLQISPIIHSTMCAVSHTPFRELTWPSERKARKAKSSKALVNVCRKSRGARNGPVQTELMWDTSLIATSLHLINLVPYLIF